MLSEKDIKPIPKYILKRIHDIDLKIEPWQQSYNRFYAYLTIWKKDLAKVTVAVTTIKGQWACKQIAVHSVHDQYCYIKDMEYNYFGYGFRVGWYEEQLCSRQKPFEDKHWGYANKKYYDPYARVINLSVISKLPQYKYSAYKFYKGRDIISYLRLYEKYPQAEYLLKLGLSPYAEKVTILRKVAKDRAFCKWLIRNREQLNLPWGNYYTVPVVLEAYKTGRPLQEVKDFKFRREAFRQQNHYPAILEIFKGWELKDYFDYIAKKEISDGLYYDYLRACRHLNIDMTKRENRFPKDFMRMHDLRIAQFREQKALEDAKKREELALKFSSVAEKYLPLQHNKRSAFICIIARTPSELVKEGECLHHCVGSLNYERKFADERSLIFFIRTKENPDKPFVTVEYSIENHRILQCYGSYNTKPNDDALHYINKIWLPYTNKAIKQIAA